MFPLSLPLSAATHSAADRDLRLGVPPAEVFQNILGRPPTSHEVASLALAPSTASTMNKLELSLQEIADTLGLDPMNPSVAMQHISGLLGKGWKFNSALTICRNIVMLASRKESHHLLSSKEFQDLRRGLCRLAALDTPKQAPILTYSNLKALVESLMMTQDKQMAALLALAWLLAGRLGEVVLLPTRHFLPLETPVRVKFTMLKGVYGAQEKCIAEGYLCSVVCDWHRHLLRKRTIPTRIFSLTPSQVISCLRDRIDPKLSGHSIRRGALTHADLRGSSSQDLMTLSSHKSSQMLQRYIGRASSERRDAMLRAGTILASP